MFEIYRNDISITRGDSAIFEITIIDKQKNTYTPSDTDEILFTVKDNTRSKAIVFQKSVTNNQVIIDPVDTEDLRYGKYVYDVQLRTADGFATVALTGSYRDLVDLPTKLNEVKDY